MGDDVFVTNPKIFARGISEGIGNAILGSLLLLLVSSVIGLPLGIAIGIYLSEFGAGRFGSLVRAYELVYAALGA